jgi:hypothetical protein
MNYVVKAEISCWRRIFSSLAVAVAVAADRRLTTAL